MVTICAWCDRYLGSDAQEVEVSHGICAPCTARQQWRDTPMLIVSPHREDMVEVLRHLLQGIPEVTVVVERRQHDRRQGRLVPPPVVERRRGPDRRRAAELRLI